MTVNDKTYFESEPKLNDDLYNPYRWHNTFHFLRLNSAPRRYNYSLTEIQNRLEHDKLPVTTTPQCCQATAQDKVSPGPREERVADPERLVRV